MAEALTPKTQPEVDRIVERMKAFLDNPCPDGPKRLSMSREDQRWVVAEIEGGREAFGTLSRRMPACGRAQRPCNRRSTR